MHNAAAQDGSSLLNLFYWRAAGRVFPFIAFRQRVGNVLHTQRRTDLYRLSDRGAVDLKSNPDDLLECVLQVTCVGGRISGSLCTPLVQRHHLVLTIQELQAEPRNGGLKNAH